MPVSALKRVANYVVEERSTPLGGGLSVEHAVHHPTPDRLAGFMSRRRLTEWRPMSSQAAPVVIRSCSVILPRPRATRQSTGGRRDVRSVVARRHAVASQESAVEVGEILVASVARDVDDGQLGLAVRLGESHHCVAGPQGARFLSVSVEAGGRR